MKISYVYIIKTFSVHLHFKVFTFIGRVDNILEGDSYFIQLNFLLLHAILWPYILLSSQQRQVFQKNLTIFLSC